MRGITVVVPTIGRNTIRRCLDSFASQLQAEDAVVVVADGRDFSVSGIVQDMAVHHPIADWACVAVDHRDLWGHPATNVALDEYVQTSHVWRIDDDDCAAHGALDAMRAHLDDPWTIFRMEFMHGHFAKGVICWRRPVLKHGDIGTPMVFARHCDARFGLRYEGDWDYVNALNDELGPPVWDETIVANIRPL